MGYMENLTDKYYMELRRLLEPNSLSDFQKQTLKMALDQVADQAREYTINDIKARLEEWYAEK